MALALNSKIVNLANQSLVAFEKVDERVTRQAVLRAVHDEINSLQLFRIERHKFDDFLTGKALLHSDILAVVILRAVGHLNSGGQTFEAETLGKLNKLLHSLDFFPRAVLPRGIFLVHPVGTVIGRTMPKPLTVVYQGVTVGGIHGQDGKIRYPVFNGSLVMYAGATVLGHSTVGENVVFSANSMVIDANIPAGSVVLGRHPNHRFVDGAHEIIKKFFHTAPGADSESPERLASLSDNI